MSLLASVFAHPVVAGGLRLLGLSLLAGGVTALVAYVFRVRVRNAFPEGASLIVGLGVVAIYLNTRLVFVQFLGEGADPLTVQEAIVNVSVFVAAGIAAYAGRTIGDRAGREGWINWTRLRPNFNPVVRARGRFISVTLPEEIADIDGYDPVHPETKRGLAGRTLEFPRGLTLVDLEAQLAERLTEDTDVGYVDVDIDVDGTVDYLAVGQRPAGIGPTLPPKTAAVAVRADPPFSATAGDTVQLWRVDETGTEGHVGTGELRASVGSIATVTTGESVAERIDPTEQYRLMTLSATSHPDKEFAAMLRRGDETMSIVEVREGSPLVGETIGSLDVTVIAVRSTADDIETIPKRDRAVRAGEGLFALGRPEALRKLEATNETVVEDPPAEFAEAAAETGPWTDDAPVDHTSRTDGER